MRLTAIALPNFEGTMNPGKTDFPEPEEADRNQTVFSSCRR